MQEPNPSIQRQPSPQQYSFQSCPRPSPNAPLAVPWTGPELLDAGPSLGTPSAAPIALTLDEVPPANVRLQKDSFRKMVVTAGGAVGFRGLV